MGIVPALPHLLHSKSSLTNKDLAEHEIIKQNHLWLFNIVHPLFVLTKHYPIELEVVQGVVYFQEGGDRTQGGPRRCGRRSGTALRPLSCFLEGGETSDNAVFRQRGTLILRAGRHRPLMQER
ncbi:hypothetical protein BC938DRAFT_478865, partial [Jimgerdemannia flammicorona]